MMIQPGLMILPATTRRLGLQDLITALNCLDPTLLNRNLRSLQDQLNVAAESLAMREMSLLQDASVRLEVLLLPFLRDAESFFRYAGDRIPQLRVQAQMALRLIGTTPPASPPGLPLFQCQNVARISSNLRMIDQRLLTLSQALRQMETAYQADANRIAQGIQRRLTPPVIPIEEGVSPPRDQTTAERTALASVRLFRQEVAAIQQLLQGALMEIVPLRVLGRPQGFMLPM